MSQLFSLRASRAFVFAILSITALCIHVGATRAADVNGWITTWAASPQARWNDDLPAPLGIAEAVDNQTIRQTARVSVGGKKVRIVLSKSMAQGRSLLAQRRSP